MNAKAMMLQKSTKVDDVSPCAQGKQRVRVWTGVTAVALTAVCSSAWPQVDYPVKPVRMIVAYPPGGVTDVIARVFAKGLADAFGQQFIIENKPGAATNIAAEHAARSAPDGYTLYQTQVATHGVNPVLFEKLSYDAAKDFAAAGLMARSTQFLFVNPGLPIKSVQDLIDYAKAWPGKLAYAYPGMGSPPHIGGELLKAGLGLNILHVAYKGSVQTAPEVISGRIQFMFDAAALPFARDGRLRVLAVADSKRWPLEPQIPSLAEGGVPNFDLSGFFAVMAPAKTPEAILEKLNVAMNRISSQDQVKKILADSGILVISGNRMETNELINHQIDKWKRYVKESGARAD